MADRFRQNAVAIDRTDGLRGLRLLDRLDLEAVYLYEKHPKEFRRLRDLLDDDVAADLLLHWREYFGLKRADDTDRSILVTELAELTPAQRRLAAQVVQHLPLILADPPGVGDLAESFHGDEKTLGEGLVVLSLISLEHGASDLRAALRTIENHRTLALEAFRQQGLEGFALVDLYGPVLEALGPALPLDQSLILLRVNSGYVDDLLLTHRPETVASHLSHVAAKGLVPAVGEVLTALRLVVEFGERGERALAKAGPDAGDVVFEDFTDPSSEKPGGRRPGRAWHDGPGRSSTSTPPIPTSARSSGCTEGRSSRRSPRRMRARRHSPCSRRRSAGRSARRWPSWRFWPPATTVRR